MPSFYISVNYQTIIASDNVVLADSIACLMIGYNPNDIMHIKMTSDNKFRSADIHFDIKSLPDPHAQDDKWEKTEHLVIDFFVWFVELILRFSGWKTISNFGADFFFLRCCPSASIGLSGPTLPSNSACFLFPKSQGVKNT